MGEHRYYNPGAVPKVIITSGQSFPPTATVELRDANDRVSLSFDDLDALRAVCCAFTEARTLLIASLLENLGETVLVRDLEQGDEAFIDGDLVTVDTVVMENAGVRVRYLDHESDSHTRACAWDEHVVRVMVPSLSAVR